jgi:hypothetical protein
MRKPRDKNVEKISQRSGKGPHPTKKKNSKKLRKKLKEKMKRWENNEDWV